MTRTKKTLQPLTTAQQLGSLIKSARDIMRKDKGLNGDLDRLPMLTWIMFLKFLDDMEQMRETDAKLAGKRFRPAIEQPYRWRDWAAKEDGITGDELIAFVNNEEAVRPDGTKGPGLFAYLRSLQGANGGDRRDVIATVFKGTINRMINGYLLRDVINKINSIHFTSSEEIHTLGHLYESMLKEMRDAAGDSGEFYTPRPVVRFMVAVTDPRLGETVLDPACGTGGFLVESYLHMEKHCKKVQDRQMLQTKSLFGGEAKPLPYLLAQMNLLLHGLESPQIDPGNSLRFPLKEVGDKDRVDIILTNPPFGGEEERGILSNFPEDKQTAETALLFLQLIMRKLRRQPKPGRAAVVLPDGILSQEGTAIRIREELATKYNLHTVVRLPRGVFEPYTKSSTSILFFDTRQPSKAVWFYEAKARAGIKAYTLTQPFLFEELAPCIEWWNRRAENDCAWKVPVSELAEHSFSLSLKNPRATSCAQFPEPLGILNRAREGLQRLDGITSRLAGIWNELTTLVGNNDWPTEGFSKLANQVKREISVEPDVEYAILAMSWYAKGLYVKQRKKGAEIQASRLYRVQFGDFVYNRLFAWKGSFAEVTEEIDGCYVSNEFPCFVVNREAIVPGYLWAYFAQPGLWDYIETLSTGTTSTSRLRLKEAKLKQFRIPIPPRQVQEKITAVWQEALKVEHELHEIGESLTRTAPAVIERLTPFHMNK